MRRVRPGRFLFMLSACLAGNLACDDESPAQGGANDGAPVDGGGSTRDAEWAVDAAPDLELAVDGGGDAVALGCGLPRATSCPGTIDLREIPAPVDDVWQDLGAPPGVFGVEKGGGSGAGRESDVPYLVTDGYEEAPTWGTMLVYIMAGEEIGLPPSSEVMNVFRNLVARKESPPLVVLWVPYSGGGATSLGVVQRYPRFYPSAVRIWGRHLVVRPSWERVIAFNPDFWCTDLIGKEGSADDLSVISMYDAPSRVSLAISDDYSRASEKRCYERIEAFAFGRAFPHVDQIMSTFASRGPIQYIKAPKADDIEKLVRETFADQLRFMVRDRLP